MATAALLLSLPLGIASAQTGTSNLTVVTQDQNGATLTGYYIQVSDSAGNTIQTGFSPGGFSLAAGTYLVSVGDYGGEYFNHWSDGTTTRSHTVTITSSGTISLTAIYSTTPPGTGSGPSIAVQSQYTNGATLSGLYVVLQQGGNTVKTGFTPISFSVTNGQTYSVTADDYTNAYFSHWSTGATSRTISVTATGSPTTLTAFYCPSLGCGGSAIVVKSQFQGGASLTGMYTTLSQNGNIVATGFTPVSFATTSGQSYSVTVSDYSGAYFNEWNNGYSVRTMPVTANASTATLDAIYTTTPSSPPPTGYSITVSSNDLNGTTLTGFYVDLRVNGNHVESGFTPATLGNLEPGVQYQVVIYWYGHYYYRHFSDGDLNRYALVTLNTTSGQNSVHLDALYQNVPKSQAASLNIIAELPNGTQIGTTFNNTGYIQHTPGMWLTITPPGTTTPFTGTYTGGSILPFILFSGQTYTVSMTTSYGNYQFAYWKDSGSTNPVRSVLLNGNSTYIAIYNYL